MLYEIAGVEFLWLTARKELIYDLLHFFTLKDLIVLTLSEDLMKGHLTI